LTPQARLVSLDGMATTAKGQAPSVSTVGIDTLTLDPANARKHDKRNMDAIKASLQRFGPQWPLAVVTRDNVVRAGNGRIQAARELGWTEVPVIFTELEGVDAVAFAIADNRTSELASWDDDVLAATLQSLADEAPELLEVAGYDQKELDKLVASVAPEVSEDEVPEPPVDPITKLGDLWLLGEHRLLCGDSTKAEDVARVMDGAKADCVFTSPPYAVGIDYGTYEDTIENLRAMLDALPRVWNGIVVDGGFAVVNYGDIIPGRKAAGTDEVCEYPMALEYWPRFRKHEWILWSRRVWCKPNARVAAPWCASSNRAASDWEHVWTWKRPGPPVVSRQGKSHMGWHDTTSDHGVDIGKEVHGAGMAVGAAARMIECHSRIKSIIHEPFCGTGTTLIAAEQLGRKCYGLEIDPAYCDVIVARWEKLTGKKATRG
jgi:DNA modification methylase